MELHYYNFKGFTESLRYLLALLKVEYKEVNYLSLDEWKEKKSNFTELNQTILSLPFLKDGDLLLSETLAIAFYLA